MSPPAINQPLANLSPRPIELKERPRRDISEELRPVRHHCRAEGVKYGQRRSSVLVSVGVR